MDQTIRTKEIGVSSGLLFRLSLWEDDEYGRQALAWGTGDVLLLNEPIWYQEQEGNPSAPVEWEWIDLLVFLGRHWPWLVLEENYPVVPGRTLPLNPLEYRRILETRWNSVSESVELEEDERVFLFEERHDLSRGMNGIFLPSLLILREGNQCWVCSAERDAVLLPFDQVHTTLQKLGDFLAAHIEKHHDTRHAPRVEEALQLWRSREQRTAQKRFELQTGMSLPELQQLHGETSAPAFFDMEDSADSLYSGNSLLAVARMSAGVISLSMQRELLDTVRGHQKHETRELDELSEEGLDEVSPSDKPYEQGYTLANWLRRRLGIQADHKIDPEELLNRWGVPVETIELDETSLHAIAFWGEKHGPVILLNISKGSFASHDHGRRTTLAHEICHLLVDRKTALPAAEILGGRTPEHPEKRARAFAAELLLPRQTVYESFDPEQDVKLFIEQLAADFEVSKQVAANQLRNSDRFEDLSHDQKIVVNQIGGSFQAEEN